jgi:hypothetical protein
MGICCWLRAQHYVLVMTASSKATQKVAALSELTNGPSMPAMQQTLSCQPIAAGHLHHVKAVGKEVLKQLLLRMRQLLLLHMLPFVPAAAV